MHPFLAGTLDIHFLGLHHIPARPPAAACLTYSKAIILAGPVAGLNSCKQLPLFTFAMMHQPRQLRTPLRA